MKGALYKPSAHPAIGVFPREHRCEAQKICKPNKQENRIPALAHRYGRAVQNAQRRQKPWRQSHGPFQRR
jgi:hypothetical protein